MHTGRVTRTLRGGLIGGQAENHAQTTTQGDRVNRSGPTNGNGTIFASSHSGRGRWLRMILGIKGNQPLDERLDEVTETFFKNVAAVGAGYTPGCVAVAALVYQLAPNIKVRQGAMLLSPAVRLFANRRG